MNKGVWVVIAVVVIAALAYFFWSSSGSNGGTGTLILQITDAPSASGLNIEKAFVTLSGIDVHKAANDTDTGTNETDSTNETEWFTVVQGPVSYDLISLVDVKQLLGSKELEPGKYTQIRLNVDSATVTINGTEYNLTIPSGKLKLIHPFTIVQGETKTLTVDFDANASVYKSGTRYWLKPTVKILEG